MEVTFERAQRAAAAVRGVVRRTPLIPSERLSEIAGAEVFLKCECFQVTGSFKVRGPVALLEAETSIRAVAAASAGNHGLGLAWAARRRGIPCTVFVPRTVAAVKSEKIQALGARLLVSPHDGYDDTEAWARERAGSATWVPAFDHPWIMAGNGGTTALEIVEDLDDVDAFVVPVGGGGLAVGLGVVVRRLAPGATILGVNTEASPAMFESRRRQQAVTRLDPVETIAEGLEGGISENSYRLGLETIDDVITVSEASIRQAVVDTLKHDRLLIEGSAAAAVAAITQGRLPCGRKRVVVVLTGSNIDASRLKSLLS